MSTKHTPGPWSVTTETFNKQQLHYGFSITAKVGLDIKYIATVEDLGYMSQETDNANAKLIAGAPDLLDELRNLINDIQIQHVNADDDYLNRLYPHRKTALELIKKITE